MKTNQILTAIAVLVGIIAGLFGATNYFATASDLKVTNQRLEYKIVSDQILNVEERVFIIETRHNVNVPGAIPIPMAPDVLETYHRLLKQLKRLYKEQDAALGVEH